MINRLATAVERGELRPSRARSIAGFLLLSKHGVSQGSRRSEQELKAEAKALGLLPDA